MSGFMDVMTFGVPQLLGMKPYSEALGLKKKPLPQLPVRDTAAAEEAARAEANTLRKKRGVLSMIATSPSGVSGEAPTLKTTLG